MSLRGAPASDAVLMTAEQLALYLQVCPRTIRTYYADGTIPVAAWVGVMPRFERAAVLAALSQRGPAKPAPQETADATIVPLHRRRIGKRAQVRS